MKNFFRLLHCDTDLSGMLALAEEIRAFSEPAQVACDDCLCLLMLAGGCTLYFCHPSHYSRTPVKSFPWLFGPSWRLPHALDPKDLESLF